MIALLGVGCLLGAMAATFSSFAFLVRRRRQDRRGRIREATGVSDLLSSHSVSLESSGYPVWVIECLVKRSQTAGSLSGHSSTWPWSLGLGSVGSLLRRTGLSGLVDPGAIGGLRRDLSLALGVGGLLLGFAFSELLGCLLLVVFFSLGWRIPLMALRRERDARSNAVESDLARMLEVVVLGLRGGLSFDRALSYFGRFFQGSLARSCVLAQTQWSYGLCSRDEALRNLADSYESKLVGRAVESIIRSLRYGTSLADDLSDAAASARLQRRSRLEEVVAKAPVKMLLPVGALILPAMLILVVGPILLELMGEL